MSHRKVLMQKEKNLNLQLVDYKLIYLKRNLKVIQSLLRQVWKEEKVKYQRSMGAIVRCIQDYSDETQEIKIY